MDGLSTADLSAVVRFVHGLQCAQDLDGFSTAVVRGLRSLVAADFCSSNDMDLQGGRIAWVSDPPLESYRFPGCEEILGQHMLENPVIAYFARGQDDRWVKTSDVSSRRAFHATTVYNEFYRKIAVEHQFGALFPGAGRSVIGIALSRGLPDFSERDRAILTAIHPHLVEGYRNARRLTELRADLAAMTTGLDSMRVGLVVLGDGGAIRLATSRARALLSEFFDERVRGSLPGVLDGWLRGYAMGPGDPDVPAVPAPFVVDRGRRRLVVRLIGEPPRWLLALSEERLGIDGQALEALGLTRREAEVLAWVAAGKRDAEIASILGISPRTVSHHLEHIYGKLGVETRTAAAACAREAVAEGS